jgi:tetratricopeptide (TPR) repeat protein
MRKLAVGVLFTCGLIALCAFAFTLYAQFALDYSLESLKQALEVSQKPDLEDYGTRVYHSSLDAMVLEGMTQKETDFESVALMEHAARAIRDAVEEYGYTRAGFYLVEVLNEKSSKRSLFLRGADSVYYFFKTLLKGLKDFWSYVLRRFQPAPAVVEVEGAGLLILGEAERMERDWKLNEAVRYYREFLDRYPDRPEKGFVRISLAHVLMKMREFDEAETLFREVRREFPGTREDVLAASFLRRLEEVQKQEGRIPEMEDWVQEVPDRLYQEDGGLRLALMYLATYQPDKALTLLEKLSEAPDRRIREKALFYRAWIHKWQGDLDQGKEIFQLLEKEPELDKKMVFATNLEIAEVHYEKKEFQQAADRYRELSRLATETTWKALSELEQSELYLFEIGNADAAKESLQRLEQIMVRGSSPSLELARIQLQEAFQAGLREEGFRALAHGRVELAFEIFTRYIKRFPRDGRVHSAIGSIYLLKGDLETALERAKKGYGLEPYYYTAAVLAYVHEKRAELEDAERYYQISIKDKDSYVTAQYNLSWVHLTTGRYKEADERLAMLEKLSPQPAAVNRAKILNNRGCTLWFLGDKEGAIQRFKKALEVLPTQKEAQMNLGLEKVEGAVPVVAETIRETVV